MVRFEPRQARALRAEAKRRQNETGAPVPDISAVVRELVDLALERRR